MQLPILSGAFTDMEGNYRVSYPRNMVPTPVNNDISKGYLRPSEGINKFSISDTFGIDRAGINWNDVCYRVTGTKLIRVDETGFIEVIGDVGGGADQARMEYSFDYLGINSDEKLFLYDGSSLQRISDPDLGKVIDFIWIDGYFMTTDGEFLVVTELNDPFSVNPTKYGSSEIDPDPIVALMDVKNEVHAVNRFTIEVFENVGGTGFPFRRVDGAQIQKGSIGTRSCCVFLDTVAFVGGGRDDSISVYVGVNGNASRIATREIDLILRSYSESEQKSIVCEAREYEGHQLLYVHLPDQTIVYDAAASRVTQAQVWFTLDSGLFDENGDSSPKRYRARNFSYVYGRWLCGDQDGKNVGEMVSDHGSHYGDDVGWQFSTGITYNSSRGVIFHEIEVVCLPGRQSGDDSYISTQYSLDGLMWSQPKVKTLGQRGQSRKRIVFYRNGKMRNYRIQRFSGLSDAFLSVSRLEAQMEPLTA